MYRSLRSVTKRAEKNEQPNGRNFCIWNMAVKRVETRVTERAGTVCHRTFDVNKHSVYTRTVCKDKKMSRKLVRSAFLATVLVHLYYQPKVSEQFQEIEGHLVYIKML